MPNEEIERKMEFIIEHQAQFSSQIGQLEDLVTRLAQTTMDRFQVNDKRFDEMDERIAALINSQIQTEENLKKTDEQVKKTDEQVKKTDEHLKKTDELLKNLIAVVDRYFREGKNGNVQS